MSPVDLAKRLQEVLAKGVKPVVPDSPVLITDKIDVADLGTFALRYYQGFEGLTPEGAREKVPSRWLVEFRPAAELKAKLQGAVAQGLTQAASLEEVRARLDAGASRCTVPGLGEFEVVSGESLHGGLASSVHFRAHDEFMTAFPTAI